MSRNYLSQHHHQHHHHSAAVVAAAAAATMAWCSSRGSVNNHHSMSRMEVGDLYSGLFRLRDSISRETLSRSTLTRDALTRLCVSTGKPPLLLLQAIRCTQPTCSCECFAPGKKSLRYCDTCSHGWVSHGSDSDSACASTLQDLDDKTDLLVCQDPMSRYHTVAGHQSGHLVVNDSQCLQPESSLQTNLSQLIRENDGDSGQSWSHGVTVPTECYILGSFQRKVAKYVCGL
ncbi:Zinc finger protein basonuclin-2 [Plakobranchus ocellatus]|uniref:Zinc finger protein basonuclin-2 n=1 Tax=Plakobranchus ocellatus TaxID=259542 RepID=A0AAV4CXA2_9GAST|nr:Zinc finger protein basonuclin-2 [Plakobranchus ocellatus]